MRVARKRPPAPQINGVQLGPAGLSHDGSALRCSADLLLPRPGNLPKPAPGLRKCEGLVTGAQEQPSQSCLSSPSRRPVGSGQLAHLGDGASDVLHGLRPRRLYELRPSSRAARRATAEGETRGQVRGQIGVLPVSSRPLSGTPREASSTLSVVGVLGCVRIPSTTDSPAVEVRAAEATRRIKLPSRSRSFPPVRPEPARARRGRPATRRRRRQTPDRDAPRLNRPGMSGDSFV